MTNYHYKALVENVDCGVKRAVVFSDDRFLNWRQASKVAISNIYSQTCVRCKANHKNDDFCMIELERGEPDRHGSYDWRDVYPNYLNDGQMELPI